MQNLHKTIRTNHHIFGLDVAVNNVRRGCGGQNIGDLNRDFQNFRESQRLFFETGAQGFAFDKFADHKMFVLAFADFVNDQNIRMVQSRIGICLLRKASKIRLVSDKLFVENFDGDPAGTFFYLEAR